MSDNGVRISDLPEAGTLTGSEILPLVQAGDTKRGTLGDLTNLVGSVGDAAIADSVATLPAPTNSGNWGIVPFGAEEGLYQDTGTWVRRSDTQAQRSIAGASLSEAWAEGTLPGGAGTKSAKEHATDAAQSAADAAQSAAYAGGFETPEFASQAAGNLLTTPGQIFRVPLGTSPQTFNWFRRLSSGSEAVSPLATSGALAASGGAALIGYTQGGTGAVSRNVQDKIRQDLPVTPYDFMSPTLQIKAALRTATSADATATTAAIQAAIDTNAREIYLPPGLYYHTSFIELGEGQHLRGPGRYAGATIRLADGAGGLTSEKGLVGITAKSGIAECQFSGFEYDGNAANNRSWGNGSNAWTAGEYDLSQTHGFYFGPFSGRVAPKRVTFRDMYIHDTIRNSIVWGADTHVTTSDLHLKNSDTDHLLYESDGPTNSTHTNLLCEGFARGSMVDLRPGSSVTNLTFKNIAVNPTVYDTSTLVVIRANDTGQSANITNVSVEGFSPDAVLGSEARLIVFSLFGPCNISGVSVKCSDATDAKPIDLFRANFALGSRGDYKVSHVRATGMPASSRLFVGDDGDLVTGADFETITFEYGDGTASTNPLIQFNGRFERFRFDKIAVSGTMAGVLFTSAASRVAKDIKFLNVTMASVNGRVCTPNSRENIVFENCDFQGAALTDLVSPSFFDQVFARNVRTGTTFYTNNGTATRSGNGSTTSFTIAHGLKTTPTWFDVRPTSAAAAGNFFVTANTTNLVVTFSTAPASGTDNLAFQWEASCTLPPVRC